MVRTVKAKAARSLKKGDSAVLLPGATGAEPWEVWILSATAAAECIQTCATPLDNRLNKSTTLALPVSQVFCLPLWLNETDPKQFAGMILLQLELRGLQPRHSTAVFDWSVVAQEGTRTLVMVGVLPAALPQEMHAEIYESFELSIRYFPFPENALTLWLEHDRLAFAITRGPHLVYFHILSEGRITPNVLQDLNCTRATLSMQGVVGKLQQVTLWKKVSAEELALLQATLQLPVNQAEHPTPKAPSPAWKLTPVVVGEARRARETRRLQKQVLLIALAVYLVAVCWIVSRYFITSHKVDELQHWQTDHADALALVHDTDAAWKDLRPVVDENSYPLEILLHVQESIPADQLHLTLFQAEDGNLLLKGEAKNVAAAFQFLDNLKSNPHFAGYTWDMGQPNLAANDLAKLQIEGTRPVGN